MGSTVVNRDKDFVENCNEFLPERFLAENVEKRKGCPIASTLDHRTTKDPFGLGKRVCLGKRAAQLEIKCLLVNVFTQYRIEIADGEKRTLKRKTKMDTLNVPDQIPPLKFMSR